VLDIKPYTPERRISSIKVPSWYSKLDRMALKKETKGRHARPTH